MSVNISNPESGIDVQGVVNWAEANVVLAGRTTRGTFNICSGKPTTVKEYFETLGKVLGAEIEINSGDLAGIPTVSWGNNTRLRSIGWSQTETLEQTFEAFIAAEHATLLG